MRTGRTRWSRSRGQAEDLRRADRVASAGETSGAGGVPPYVRVSSARAPRGVPTSRLRPGATRIPACAGPSAAARPALPSGRGTRMREPSQRLPEPRRLPCSALPGCSRRAPGSLRPPPSRSRFRGKYRSSPPRLKRCDANTRGNPERARTCRRQARRALARAQRRRRSASRPRPPALQAVDELWAEAGPARVRPLRPSDAFAPAPVPKSGSSRTRETQGR